MKLKLFGLLFILLGFTAPFILKATFPNFLYATSLSTAFFWIAFLLILRPLNYSDKFNPYLRWASYAIWLNIILTMMLVICFYIVFELNIQRGFFGDSVLYYLSFMANPIRSVFDGFVAQQSEQKADGTVIITYSFIRSLLTCLFNLVFYSSAGIFMKIIIDKKITSGSSGLPVK